MEYMFLPLKKFADFEGRARRKEYWMFILFTLIGGFVFGFIDEIIYAGWGWHVGDDFSACGINTNDCCGCAQNARCRKKRMVFSHSSV
jgi:uncharacterized membrane protein YhaH (DUF805 family)